jgi:parvulin-like peptidyl-prolyl isomerase
MYIGIAVVSAALILTGIGVYYQWYLPEVKPLGDIALEVNGKKYNAGYLVDDLDHYTGGQYSYATYMLTLLTEQIPKNLFIVEAAEELGYSVTGDEVKDMIKENNLKDNKAVRDIVESQLVLQKLKDEYFSPQVPVSGEQRNILAMFLESESRALEIAARIATGEDFADLAAELSLDAYTKDNGGDMGWHPEGILDGLLNSTGIDEYVFSAEVGVLSLPIFEEEKDKEIGYWLIKITERDPEDENRIYVRAMLLSSKEEALMVRQKLMDGEDFGELAGEYSQLPEEEGVEEKGDLGWINKGTMTEVFDGYVYDLENELGAVSMPLKDEERFTQGGYWLIQVVEKEDNRQLSEEDRETLINRLIVDWIESLVEDSSSEVINYLDDEMSAFILQRLAGG